MTDSQFDRLFKYMEKRFDEIDKRFEETAGRQQVEALQTTVDYIVKRLDTQEAEQASRDSRLERLVAWARRVAAKIGIPLEGL